MDSTTPKTALQKRYRLYRLMKQWRDLSDDEIMAKAVASFNNPPKPKVVKVVTAPPVVKIDSPAPDLDLDITRRFSNAKEQLLAQSLLQRYIADYNIEHVSEQNTVRDVIYLEVVQQRLQDRLNQDDNDLLKVVPFDLLEAIHRNAEAITKLKNTLGLNKSKDKRNAYDELDHLKRRYAKWLSENQASRHIKCPHCVKPILLKMRTDAWEALGHPWFQDNVIYNKHLFKYLDQTVTIDREFISKVLEVSPDYIGWVLEKVRKPSAVVESEPVTVVETKGITDGDQTQTSGEGGKEITSQVT